MDGGINLFAYTNNDPVNKNDPFGLDEECSEECSDDAGRKCYCSEIKVIYILVQTSGAVGHTFLSTPKRKIGFYPKEEETIYVGDYYGKRQVPGETKNDSERPFDKEIPYTACPATQQALESSIDRNLQGPYQLGNRGAPNCVGWACQRVSDAGITPP
ncbi:MAG: hypothetical protein BWK74_05990, partial [Desulfobacteraceae bacterium A6]